MPKKTYKPSWLGRSAHFQTVYPTLFRRISGVNWQRSRIDTPDGDFIDLDWLCSGYTRLVMLCHGLEGSSDTHYMKGMARACSSKGWDAMAYNFRGCSGEPNRLAKSYHSGSTDDLALVIKHSLTDGSYQKIALIGFSLGANQVLKYLGEERNDRPEQLCGGVAISPPCDLSACSDRLEQAENWIYQARFLRSLLTKVKLKKALIEVELGPVNTRRCRSIRDFDEQFVAPLNGFAGAEDYYQQSSCLQFLSTIKYYTLLLSSLDDPFMGKTCFPTAEAIDNPMLDLTYTRYGGHVGYLQNDPHGYYWGEQQSVEFLEYLTSGKKKCLDQIEVAF
jgi:uncharacterized protein